MRGLLHPSILLGCLFLAACTAPSVVDDAGAIDGSLGSVGLVQIERLASADPRLSGDQALVEAAFARYRSVDGRAVLGLLGGPATDTDRCVLLAGGDAMGQPEASVELVDMGSLDVSVAGTESRVFPRTFPDLAGVVSGAFYAEDALLAPARAELDEYLVSATGTSQVPAFEALVVPPAGFSELEIDGLSADGLSELVRGTDIPVLWDAGDPMDYVELEIAASGRTVSCVAQDDGQFTVPGDVMTGLEVDAEARVSVRRVRRELFDLAGFDAAWASVAVTSTYLVALR
ncbi:MAG: hypothetical protein AAGF12_40580 [Myxococcota bacterium]